MLLYYHYYCYFYEAYRVVKYSKVGKRSSYHWYISFHLDTNYAPKWPSNNEEIRVFLSCFPLSNSLEHLMFVVVYFILFHFQFLNFFESTILIRHVNFSTFIFFRSIPHKIHFKRISYVPHRFRRFCLFRFLSVYYFLLVQTLKKETQRTRSERQNAQQ